ncbi:MAG: hypothetical protein RL518_1450 [Pseudomonadota bacterium]|jgi:hypothetical protein
MKNQNLLLAALLSLTLPAAPVRAEEVQSAMQKLLVPLRTLQPFLADEDKFTDSDNEDTIHEQLVDLRRNFHSLERIPTRYKSQPGFQESIKNTAELLDDSSRRFDEGRKEYAWWRLQRLPTDCFSCHATYKVSSHYSNTAMVDESLAPLDRARFLMATRQFGEAKRTLLAALGDPAYRLYDDQILRSLLLIETRISKDPKESLGMFKGILQSDKLPLDDAHMIQRWLKGLEAWSKAPPVAAANKLATGEKLIRAGATRGIDFAQDEVALLRGTALVHESLDGGNLTEPQRRKAVYLLGYAYSFLPQFFTEGWDELYLEKCIEEFPNTQEAKWAYNIYSDKIMNDFTGSGGSNIPPEVQLHLEQLRKKAFGEVDFAPKA